MLLYAPICVACEVRAFDNDLRLTEQARGAYPFPPASYASLSSHTVSAAFAHVPTPPAAGSLTFTRLLKFTPARPRIRSTSPSTAFCARSLLASHSSRGSPTLYSGRSDMASTRRRRLRMEQETVQPPL
ncbi:hypothetical protein DFH09DRAFT_1328737 [Mycena vulgaris]|nr:hypothetical protein DFH09DRAFT_1328737 [Mycena vulgaris]